MKKITSIFALMVLCLATNLSANELKVSFDKCDLDKDGKLTFKEYNIWPNHRNPKNPIKKFFFLDKNKDKYIELSEYRTWKSFRSGKAAAMVAVGQGLGAILLAGEWKPIAQMLEEAMADSDKEEDQGGA